MIIVTGAAGFIGSCLVGKLNNKGFRDLVLVDAFGDPEKEKNLASKVYREKVGRDHFFEWMDRHGDEVDFIFHIGARTDTAEFDKSVFDRLNLDYSKKVWEYCTRLGIPLVYASSAATYGSGELGYADDHDIIPRLLPLNPYGESKNDFDKWVLTREQAPPSWYGLKFFNVYGPNEYHKGRMGSVILHAFRQISESGELKLFRSHREGIPDGGQQRDFIYVKDLTDVMFFLYAMRPESHIYNLGTGKARSFLDLAKAVFDALDLKETIQFIDTPEDIRDKYQYFTEAEMHRLRNAGYHHEFYTLEAGIRDYVLSYLQQGETY